MGGHLRVLEVAGVALVGAEEQLLVGPLEVEQLDDRLAHAHVLEHRAADVEGVALHAPGILVVQLLADDAAVAHGGGVVGGRPVLRDAFLDEVELAGLERLQRHGEVAVGVDHHGIEVVEAAVHRQVVAPVVLDPLVADRATGVDLGDAVGTAAQRRLHVGLAEIAAGPPVLGQDRQLAEDQRQLAVAGVPEVEAHAQPVLGDHLVDVRVVVAVHRVALAHQGFEGEHHVLGGHRRAVVEARLRPEVEAHEPVLRVLFDLLRQQAVFGERLVQRVEGQGVVDQVDLRRRVALGNEGVEAVEAAEVGQPQGSALRRVGVDVIEVLEAGRIFRGFVVQGQGMLRRSLRSSGQAEQQPEEQGRAAGADHNGFSWAVCHQARRPSV
ncbi:hypothetical protein D3C76_900630 [compost metagenome]